MEDGGEIKVGVVARSAIQLAPRHIERHYEERASSLSTKRHGTTQGHTNYTTF